MPLNSLPFLFFFLLPFFGVYYLAPLRWRNGVLFLGSLVFYAVGIWETPWQGPLLLLLTVLTWYLRVLLSQGRGGRWLLPMGLTLLFGILFGFKLYSSVLGGGIPLGMSFYTFQMAAFLVRASREREKTEKLSLLDYATGILMFPKFLSGPLAEPGSLSRQLHKRRYSAGKFDYGLRTFVMGLGMKVLLADRIGALWRQVKALGFASVSSPLAWLGIVSFGLQLYFDFAGYSQMALGLGQMLGFRLPENFQTPYCARSVSEFWRRWHITLGAWFRDYVYIPLGGSRQGKGKTMRNLLIVWLFTGLWHGFALHYVCWAMFLFFLIAMEKLWLGKLLERSGPLAHVYVVFAILMSWVFFAAPSLRSAVAYFGRLFPFFGTGEKTVVLLRDFWKYLPLLGLGILFATPWPRKLWDRMRGSVLDTVVCLLVFWGCVYSLSVSAGDPFMYFAF